MKSPTVTSMPSPPRAHGIACVTQANWSPEHLDDPWVVPKGVTPDVRYCAHRIEDYEDLVTRFTDKRAKSSHNRWYRNDYRDGRLDGDMRADVSTANHLGDYAPNTTCLDTH